MTRGIFENMKTELYMITSNICIILPCIIWLYTLQYREFITVVKKTIFVSDLRQLFRRKPDGKKHKQQSSHFYVAFGSAIENRKDKVIACDGSNDAHGSIPGYDKQTCNRNPPNTVHEYVNKNIPRGDENPCSAIPSKAVDNYNADTSGTKNGSHLGTEQNSLQMVPEGCATYTDNIIVSKLRKRQPLPVEIRTHDNVLQGSTIPQLNRLVTGNYADMRDQMHTLRMNYETEEYNVTRSAIISCDSYEFSSDATNISDNAESTML